MAKRKFLNPLRDKQQDLPVARCAACGGEIYPGEKCYRIIFRAEVYCPNCIVMEEADDDTWRP